MTAPGTIEVEQVNAQFPKKLRMLFERWRYKSMDSGRGAAKSWSVADALLWLGFDATINGWRAEKQPLRIVCGRETQNSIKESVHALLKDRIKARRCLSEFYTVLEREIRGANGTLFIFKGLRDPDALKSLEGADILWIEEAQGVTKETWDIVTPTVRKEGTDAHGDWSSEIWATWNPRLDTDPTYVKFKVNPPTGAKVVSLGWRENPWFPRTLEIERLDMLRDDPVAYRNVWEGETRSSVEGAIFAAEIDAALADGRIGNFPRDRSKPVNTYWDLGFGDKCAIWFEQAVDGWHRLVDHLEDNAHTIDWYIVQLQQKGYMYGTHWLPHDCVDTIIHKNLAGGDKSRSIEMIMRAAGLNVRVAPKLFVADRINAGRMIFPQVQINRETCKLGINRLQQYQWGPVPILKNGSKGLTSREPQHDENSHTADAYQCMAVCAKQPKAPVKAQPRQEVEYSAYG